MKSRLDLNIEFGNLAISEGFTTPEQINISQRIVDAFEAEDPRKSMDVILLDRGYITYEQWTYLLEKMGIIVVLCPHCNKGFKEVNVDFGTVFTCKHCGEMCEYNGIPSGLPIHQTFSICDNTLSPMVPPTYDQYIGKLLGGKYKIIEKIATGGWSTIYKATRTLLDIDDIVAVKILHLNLSDNPHDIKRFYNEAAIIRELHHPNAIHLYDFDRDSNGTIYMAMEFVYGQNLKETIRDTGPFAVARMLNIIYQVCEVIATAHKHPKKIIHRDITPQNIMLTKAGETGDFVKVLDFGIVKLRTHDNVSLTGSIVGTPLYMAPEQWRGECDERTDIYSLGIIMYEMLTGVSPFKGDQITLMHKHLHEKPQPLRKIKKNLEIPKVIEGVIFKCLEKNKNKRPRSIEDLKLLLQEAEVSVSKKYMTYSKAGIFAAILTILISPVVVLLFFLSNKHGEKHTISTAAIRYYEADKKTLLSQENTNDTENAFLKSEIPQLPAATVELKSSRPASVMNDSNIESNKQELPLQTIKRDFARNLPGDTIAKKTSDDNKYYNKLVVNVPKYDISKEAKNIVVKADTGKVLKNEIQTWIQTYKNAWEKGDIETLKTLGQITTEEEEDRLRNHYLYVRDIKVSIQNETVEINEDKRQTIVSFDRTDEWTDERGERHRKNLPRIAKTLRKENNIWKIVK